jgi:hypothetical protein
MADVLDHPEDATADEIVDAVDRDSDERIRQAVLPDLALAIEPASVAILVADYRRVRNAHLGEYVAPRSELSDDPIRIATAIREAAADADPDERDRLLEDLVDLQAFVEDPPAGLRPPPAPAGSKEPLSGDRVLESVRWRQAATIAALLGHPTVIGDHNAIRVRWTAIGDAGAALRLVMDYREQQAGGLGAMVVYPVAALAGFGVAVVMGLGRPSIVALAVLGLAWFGSPAIGVAVGAIESRLQQSDFRRRLPGPVGAVELVLGIGGIVILPFLFGLVVTGVAKQLELP